MDKFYNKLICLLNRSFNGQSDESGIVIRYGWHLSSDALAYFMCNYTLAGCESIDVSVVGNMDIFETMAHREEFLKTGDNVYQIGHGVKLIIHKVKSMPEILEEFPIDFDRYMLQFPRNIGDILDTYNPQWTESTRRLPKPEAQGVFFDKERRKNGHDLIAKMLECGECAGIRDKMFLAFGNLLGYALRHDFMPKDDDVDMCILADDMPQEQRYQYLVECTKAGLLANRMRGPWSIDGRYAWFSIGPKSPFTEHGVKSCNWFWFKHGGFWWHSKGTNWIGRKGLSEKYPTAKGIPENVFSGEFKEIVFGGNRINAPKNIGKCLDWWYTDWLHRKAGSSNINTILVMPNEKDKRTWYIESK